MPVPPLRNFDQVRKAITDANTRIAQVADQVDRLSQVNNDFDEHLALEFVTFGVRLGRITEHVAGTENLAEVSHGYAQLVNIKDYSTDSDSVPAVYNITEKEYTVGTLVALLPVQGSFFICSDPGIFPATILPLVTFTGPVDSHFVAIGEDTPESLIFGGPVTFVVSDALDGGGDYVMSIRLISGDFVYSQGDSDVEENVIPGTPPYIELQGTLAELNDLFADNTTATLTVEMPYPGTFTLEVTLIEAATNRTGTYEIEVLVTPTAGGTVTTIDVQEFTSGTSDWTKPAGAVLVHVRCIGGGGSGASGRKGTNSSNRGGGGGGNGGRFAERVFHDPTALGATESVTVGAGNASPGASQATNSTNGNAGNAGAATAFGNWVRAHGGEGGLAGTDTGTGGTVLNAAIQGVDVDGTSAFSTFAGATGGVPSSKHGGAAGGVGGGITSGGTLIPGLNGGTGGFYSANTGAAGGALGGTGAAGSAGSSPAAGIVHGGGGGGGGGPGSQTGSTSGGAGGAGATHGAGGGGGGAATNAIGNSGAGGNGANGYCVVTTVCEA